jgi:hypothetical protein
MFLKAEQWARAELCNIEKRSIHSHSTIDQCYTPESSTFSGHQEPEAGGIPCRLFGTCQGDGCPRFYPLLKRNSTKMQSKWDGGIQQKGNFNAQPNIIRNIIFNYL